MKISLTGSSSTGKTTLAVALLGNVELKKIVQKFIYVDGRELIKEMGYKSLDSMPRKQQKNYQLQYFHQKINSEKNQENYITDRSFVDIAAYWIERDTYDKPNKEQELIITPCKKLSKRYDYNFYLPTKIIDFEKDGFRSENPEFNSRIDRRIRIFLNEWDINYRTVRAGAPGQPKLTA